MCARKEKATRGGREGGKDGGAYLEFLCLVPHLGKVDLVENHHLRLGG